MPGTKDFFFKPDSLLRLLTHYTDGEVPMDGEVTDLMVHQNLDRVLGIMVKSDDWDTSDPLHIRYDGKRIASWAKNDGSDKMVWEQRAETPNRQN